MAGGIEKLRKSSIELPRRLLPGDPITKGLVGLHRRVDKSLGDRGAFFETTLSDAKRKADSTKKEQEQRIGKQKQVETLKLAETESEIGRRKLLRTTGGRRSLIASR